MENQLVIMLGAIADKLGTTVEMLWGILLNQAKVSAVLSLIYIGFVLIMGGSIYVLHKKFSKQINGYSDYNMYEEKDGLGVLMTVLTALWICLAVGGIFEIENAITALLNPEYWALQEILEKCG